ncbi:OmpA family protein [Vibrio vulnificus]|nr:OmpA family protein [Vibrio vulnificus]
MMTNGIIKNQQLRFKRYPLAIALALFAAQSVSATPLPYWYAGVEFGVGNYDNGGNPGSLESDRTSFANGVFMGYQWNEYLALEGGYQDLGSAHASYANGTVHAEFHQALATVKVGVPLWERVYPYVKVGGSVWHGESRGLVDGDEHGVSPVYGAGIGLSLTERLSLSVGYQFTQSIGDDRIGHSDHHFTALGLTYAFTAPLEVIQFKERIVEREVLVEKPVEVIVEKQTITKNVVLSGRQAETLFAINSSKLSNTSSLDGVLADLLHYPLTQINIIGHTDNTGSQKYNQWISERRAQSVANYFIENGVNPERVTTSGRGEDMPIADNSTESGRAMNRRVEMRISDFEIQTQE